MIFSVHAHSGQELPAPLTGDGREGIIRDFSVGLLIFNILFHIRDLVWWLWDLEDRVDYEGLLRLLRLMLNLLSILADFIQFLTTNSYFKPTQAMWTIGARLGRISSSLAFCFMIL